MALTDAQYNFWLPGNTPQIRKSIENVEASLRNKPGNTHPMLAGAQLLAATRLYELGGQRALNNFMESGYTAQQVPESWFNSEPFKALSYIDSFKFLNQNSSGGRTSGRLRTVGAVSGKGAASTEAIPNESDQVLTDDETLKKLKKKAVTPDLNYGQRGQARFNFDTFSLKV